MKLVTYRYLEQCAVGALSEAGDAVYPILGAADMSALIAAWETLDKETLRQGAPLPITDVQLLAPIPHPAQDVICLGINYFDHAAESGTVTGKSDNVPKNPIYFAKRVNECVAPGGEIPSHSDIVADLDYEAELAVIIGRDVCGISREDALDAVFGYTILNDVSARTIQRTHQQWYRGKSLDGFTPLGPCIVTKDEFDVTQPKRIQCYVNHELRQDSTIDRLIFDTAYCISELSQGMTLRAGTIISTGTPSGVGMGFDPPKWLQPGDVVTCRIEGIGDLTNTVR
jgi:2-keto-4-pentenoate hydratase/2-oxohepta-3-ene-1,7-dioic acid hydratase in catechol pathway